MGRFLLLLKKILPQVKIDNVVDQGESKTKEINIKTNRDFITSRLGQDLSVKEISQILERLGFVVNIKNEELNIQVPHWRATGDVSIPEDIVEEVGRIYGYDNLETKPLKFEVKNAVLQPEQILQKRIKTYLSRAAGLSEVYNYPWAEDRLFTILGINKDDLIKLSYPPADDLGNLQKILIPNLLQVVETNARFYDNFGLFELARVFKKVNQQFHENQEDKLPLQPKHLSVVLYGDEDIYYRTKGIFEGLMEFLQVSNWQYDSSNFEKLKYLNTEDQLRIKIGEEVVGYLGSLAMGVRKKLDIKNNKSSVVLCELDFDKIIANYKKNIKYKPIPQFPSIKRDFAFELDYKIKWQDIKDEIGEIDKLIKQIEFLSVFDLEDKKSLAFRVEFYSDKKTLTSEEVEVVEKKIIKYIKNKFKADLRK